jgi:hypothetical protein
MLARKLLWCSKSTFVLSNIARSIISQFENAQVRFNCIISTTQMPLIWDRLYVLYKQQVGFFIWMLFRILGYCRMMTM